MISMDIVATNNLAEIIRTKFRASGMSIKKLAEWSGVPYAAVYGLIHGTNDARLSTATKICRVLGLELKSTEQDGGKKTSSNGR